MSHILLVSTDDSNPALLRDVGQLAMALRAKGETVSVLSSHKESSPFEALSGVNILHAKDVKYFRTPLAAAVKSFLSENHSVDVVHVFHLGVEHMDLLQTCHKLRVPVVAHVHDKHVFQSAGLRFWNKEKFVNALQKCAQLVVSAPYLKEEAEAAGFKNVRCIEEGVQLERFKPVLSKRPMRRELKLPESATVVCCMASIHPDNKQLDVLKTCAPLGAWLYLLFVGRVEDDAYYAEIQAEILKMDVEPFVVFRDAVDNPEDYLKAIDVFMLFGGVEERRMTILEAMSSGAPVVLSPSSSSAQLTSDGQCGVVLYENNVMASQTVEKVLTDSSYRHGRSLCAREFVVNNYDFKKMVHAYLELYDEVISVQEVFAAV